MNQLVVVVALVGLVAACKDDTKKEFQTYMDKSKRIEAKLYLTKLSKAAKLSLDEKGTFPKGKAGPVPAEPCCKGVGGKCAEVPAATWSADPVWDALFFEVYEAPRFQYTYESDGDTVTATATGDLDCDGKQIVYKLEMKRLPDGTVSSNIVEPALDAD